MTEPTIQDQEVRVHEKLAELKLGDLMSQDDYDLITGFLSSLQTRMASLEAERDEAIELASNAAGWKLRAEGVKAEARGFMARISTLERELGEAKSDAEEWHLAAARNEAEFRRLGELLNQARALLRRWLNRWENSDANDGFDVERETRQALNHTEEAQ